MSMLIVRTLKIVVLKLKVLNCLFIEVDAALLLQLTREKWDLIKFTSDGLLSNV